MELTSALLSAFIRNYFLCWPDDTADRLCLFIDVSGLIYGRDVVIATNINTHCRWLCIQQAQKSFFTDIVNLYTMSV